MADIETRVVIGADTGPLEEGMAAVRAALQRMRAQFAGLGTAARQTQAQIGVEMAQVGAAVRAPLEPWQKFALPIEHSISSALTDAVLGIRRRGGMREVMLGIEKSAVGGIMNNLVKGLGNSLVGPLFTSLLGSGGSGGGLANLLFGGGREATRISLLSIIAANTGATAAAAGASAVTGPLGSIGGSILGGGFFGSVFKGLGSFFTSIFTRGGIVPSAAGGWSLPSFAGAMPAMLHSREMVLPADISQGLQNMIRGGGPHGANGGEVHVHNHFHGPADGASIGRWFASNRRALAETVRDAWNSGALSLT